MENVVFFYILVSTAATTTPSPNACDGVSSFDWACCSNSSPCNVGGGDCDNDSECAGNLSCGTDNCINDFPSGSWHSTADCCVGECCAQKRHSKSTMNKYLQLVIVTSIITICVSSETHTVVTVNGDSCIFFAAPTAATTTPPPNGCNGIPSMDWACCSNSSPCNLGGGDCDSDSECAGNLSCGTDNCINDFPSGSWSGSADCCIGGEYNCFKSLLLFNI